MINIKIQFSFNKKRKRSNKKAKKLFSLVNKFLTKKISPTLIFTTIVLSLVLSLGINMVFAWTDPVTDPPLENVATPINTSSTAQTKSGDLTLTSNLYLGSQRFFGSDTSALYYYSNHDTIVQLLFRDAQGNNHGRFYGGNSGLNFGFLDGDGNWALLMSKDNYTSFRIDDTEKLRIDGDSLNLGSKEAIRFSDTWLRLNQAGSFSSGVYTPGTIRADTSLCIGTDCRTAWPSGGIGAEADTLQTVTDRGNTTTNSIQVPILYDKDNTGYYLSPDTNSWLYRIYSYDIRSDIYYDRNDTYYRVDPNGTSRFSTINVVGNVDGSRFRSIGAETYYLDPDGTSNLNAITAVGNVDANRFRAVGNTTYYVDPDGRSVLGGITSYGNIACTGCAINADGRITSQDTIRGYKDLVVTDSISAGGSIYAEGSIAANGTLYANTNLSVAGNVIATGEISTQSNIKTTGYYYGRLAHVGCYWTEFTSPGVINQCQNGEFMAAMRIATGGSYKIYCCGQSQSTSGGGWSGTCFTAKTQVLMSDGNIKNIANVRAGEYILTKESESSSKMVRAKVLGVYEHDVSSYILINKYLEVTSEHRIFANNEWKAVGNLEIGDKLLDKNGNEVIVSSIKTVEKESNIKVYNLQIEKYGTYFADGFYVHNLKEDPPNLPQ